MVGKILMTIVICLVSAVVVFFSSCGTTRAVVHNGKDNAVTTITITTNNPIDVSASPNVSPNVSIE